MAEQTALQALRDSMFADEGAEMLLSRLAEAGWCLVRREEAELGRDMVRVCRMFALEAC